jgi:shikimate dehydrogenase
MREENRLLMEQNGRVVFIDRPLEELSVAGRPLSQAHGVQELAATRMPRYASWASVHLPCTGSAAGDAYALLELLHLPRTGHLALHH